jgi:hypothetical protein
VYLSCAASTAGSTPGAVSGDIVGGMHRQGWDLQLTEYGDGHWRATFFVTGQAHSIVGGTGWEPTAWRAVQRAAWEVLTKA